MKEFAEDIESFLWGLRVEGEAILRASQAQDAARVGEAVRLICKCRGRVITTGVGKSAVVAKKLASTMTSTGTAAFFLHPTDALHGDLGGVRPDDVIVAISYSGETDELVELLPYLRHRSIPIISIVGKIDSTLGRASSAVLNGGVETEICPHKLAPTTSTTVALALSDALAMSAMRHKQISVSDFAANHPSGRLGKRLVLKVSDIMRTGEQCATISPETPFMEVTHAISRGGSGVVSVVDADGKLAGLVTDGDLRRTIERTAPERLGALFCREFMTSSPVTVTPETLAYEAFLTMQNRSKPLNVLAVAEADGRSCGILKIQDIIKSGIV